MVKDSDDDTQVRLVYANQSEDDILLREELEAYAEKHHNFRVWFTVDK